MRYRIQVLIRTRLRYSTGGARPVNFATVLRNGTVKSLDGVGFYLVGLGEYVESYVRSQIGVAIGGVVVVQAQSVFEAVNRFHRDINHPGVVGTGEEKNAGKAKAIYRTQGPSFLIWELPDCGFDRCFSISPEGWAKCRHVADDPINKRYGYCHCVLQRADEPPTGCLTEAYIEKVLDDHYEEKIDDAGIHYVPFQPDVYRQIEREYDGD